MHPLFTLSLKIADTKEIVQELLQGHIEFGLIGAKLNHPSLQYEKYEEDEIIIVDAGSGIRRLGNLLVREKRDRISMIFTHSHWDHILGFPFFKPVYRRGTAIQMFGCPLAQESIQGIISRTMEAPYFPVNFQDLQADISYHEACESSFAIESVTVTHIPLSHPNQGYGYKFTGNGKDFVFLTDNELAFHHDGGRTYPEYVNFCRGADFLIHDAEFTEKEYRRSRSWGLSVFTDALRLALEAKVRKFGLFHHNQERTDADKQAGAGSHFPAAF